MDAPRHLVPLDLVALRMVGAAPGPLDRDLDGDGSLVTRRVRVARELAHGRAFGDHGDAEAVLEGDVRLDLILDDAHRATSFGQGEAAFLRLARSTLM